MKIDIIKVGPLETNCYILTLANGVIVIDPGFESDKIIDWINNKNVVGIFYTHSHYDHVTDLHLLCDKYKIKANDFENFKNVLEVINTPGHHYDSKCFYFKNDNVMFTGDFLFKDTFGRVDLPESDISDMINSIKLIEKYPDDIIIYPGHGDSSNLGYEKNKFLEYCNYLNLIKK